MPRVVTMLARVAGSVHTGLYRRTSGKRGGSINGMPVLLLTTTGRKSGQARTRPVSYLPQGDSYVVCGSYGGADVPPGWVANLRSTPAATVEVGDRTLAVTAREAVAGEYQELWPQYVAAYPRFGGYQTKTERRLPLFVLEPEAARAG